MPVILPEKEDLDNDDDGDSDDTTTYVAEYNSTPTKKQQREAHTQVTSLARISFFFWSPFFCLIISFSLSLSPSFSPFLSLSISLSLSLFLFLFLTVQFHLYLFPPSANSACDVRSGGVAALPNNTHRHHTHTYTHSFLKIYI